MADHSRLGRGLAALIGDVGEEISITDSGRKPRRAPIENLRSNPRNPRRLFTDAELAELADSIRERGIIQPIVVRALQSDNFEIIAGERRWRAAQQAGQKAQQGLLVVGLLIGVGPLAVVLPAAGEHIGVSEGLVEALPPVDGAHVEPELDAGGHHQQVC